jgi:rhodanese-related sulfurtransferase
MSELEINVAELQRRRKAGEKFMLIPMRTIPANLQALDSDEDVICYCHHGQRSLDVAAWLRAQGVENAQSLAGGIDRWSIEIDPAIPRY